MTLNFSRHSVLTDDIGVFVLHALTKVSMLYCVCAVFLLIIGVLGMLTHDGL